MSLTARALQASSSSRSSFRLGSTRPLGGGPVEDGLAWWTFAGLHANAGMMAGMGSLLGVSSRRTWRSSGP